MKLAKYFETDKVVGIDIAGQEDMNPLLPHCFTLNEVNVYRAAKQMGIHRTCHAGEAGPASNVTFALEEMGAERIGHGYSIISDEDLYQKCVADNIHFETCPSSSYFTGSIVLGRKNPIVQFALDNANFSINKDDPTVMATTLDDEYDFLRQFGLNEAHFVRAVSLFQVNVSFVVIYFYF